MKFIDLHVRTAFIVHGFDSDNKEIVEHLNETEFVRKLIAVKRIQSISEKYLLVSSSYGRIMYWEYEGNIGDICNKLAENDLLLRM